jgi:hypothetical protein
MKRIGAWAIGIGALVSVGPLAVERGYAGENEAKCTLATLNGQYLFGGGSATLFPPAFGVTAPSIANSAGYHIFYGDGTGMDLVTFTVNGVNQNVPSPVPTTYTVLDHRRRPDGRDDLVPRDEIPCPPDQHAENVERARADRHRHKNTALVAPEQAAPVKAEAFEQENVTHGERVPACALHARPSLRKF